MANRDGIMRPAKEKIDFLSLPFEVQSTILSYCIAPPLPPSPVLRVCSQVLDASIPQLYANIFLPSIPHLTSFLGATSGSHRLAPQYARSFVFNVPGVPGGSTSGGRESARSSPGPQTDSEREVRLTRERDIRRPDRLLLASKALLLCPNLRSVSIEMYGIRHSDILTDPDFLEAESNTFRDAIASLQQLESFQWVTPRSANFIGFSVAVVDLVFAPLLEGLEIAALNISGGTGPNPGSQGRFRHPLRRLEIHHSRFPSDGGRRLFSLFSKFNPDLAEEDEGGKTELLFSSLERLVIRSAINVKPRYVAFLALSWEVTQSESIKSALEENGEGHFTPLEMDITRRVELADAFVSSIWGERVTSENVKEEIKVLVEWIRDRKEANQKPQQTTNAYIQALEESTKTEPELPEIFTRAIRSLDEWQVNHLVERACSKVHIEVIEKAIAGLKTL